MIQQSVVDQQCRNNNNLVEFIPSKRSIECPMEVFISTVSSSDSGEEHTAEGRKKNHQFSRHLPEKTVLRRKNRKIRGNGAQNHKNLIDCKKIDVYYGCFPYSNKQLFYCKRGKHLPHMK